MPKPIKRSSTAAFALNNARLSYVRHILRADYALQRQTGSGAIKDPDQFLLRASDTVRDQRGICLSRFRFTFSSADIACITCAALTLSDDCC
jgi:hypothetical protein